MMAKPPEDLVVRILRDIQSTLADHGKRFDRIDQRFDGLGQRLDEPNEATITALGLASHAHVRDDSMKKDINDLKRRETPRSQSMMKQAT